MILKILRGIVTRFRLYRNRFSVQLASRYSIFFAKLLGATIGKKSALLASEISGSFTHLTIEEEAAIGKCSLQLLAPVCIGRRAIINDGVRILTGKHSLSEPHFPLLTAPVTIGPYAWVATGSLILPGITIGEGAVVAAGAVVTKNVEPYDIVGGNPAKVIGKRTATQLEYRPGLIEYIYG